MRRFLILGFVVLVVGVRLWQRHRRTHSSGGQKMKASSRVRTRSLKSTVALVAAREVRERVHTRLFRVGTVIILLVVAGAIVIPVLTRSTPTPERVGVVGSLSSLEQGTLQKAASSAGTTVRIRSETTVASAKADLEAGRVDVVVEHGTTLLVKYALSSSDTSTTARFVSAVATELGTANAVAAAGLSPAQIALLSSAHALAVDSLHASKGGHHHVVDPTALIGVILIFTMLSQYNTWTLIGVMEEKTSRVIEVLLAAVRPLQLLGGKVLGIGLVALAQATAIVAFALTLASLTGSNLVHGTSPLVVSSTLLWLIVGYAFYCWVYAAAGSMAERQDQVQSLAFPLSLPMIFGYVLSIIGASSGSPSMLLKVMAYVPPTAPFAMPVLVGMRAATWWEFFGSVLISVVATVFVARLAARIYRRSILRTGRKLRWRDVVASKTA